MIRKLPPFTTYQNQPLTPLQLFLDNRRPIRVCRHSNAHVSCPLSNFIMVTMLTIKGAT